MNCEIPEPESRPQKKTLIYAGVGILILLIAGICCFWRLHPAAEDLEPD